MNIQIFGGFFLVIFPSIIYGKPVYRGDDSKQSPISINPAAAILKDNLPPLQFKGHWLLGPKSVIKNDGHTIKIEIGDTLKNAPTLQGGPLLHERYIFTQAHFHWGKRSTFGSEHMINKDQYSMEVHLVHYSSKFKSFKKALGEVGGVAVVGFFLEVQPQLTCDQKRPFNKVVQHVKGLRKSESSQLAESDILSFVRKLATPEGYYFYNGSLTTEPYTEYVQWILYPTVVNISEDQIAPFRQIYGSHNYPVITNWRGVQPLHGREVDFVERKRSVVYCFSKHS